MDAKAAARWLYIQPFGTLAQMARRCHPDLLAMIQGVVDLAEQHNLPLAEAREYALYAYLVTYYPVN